MEECSTGVLSEVNALSKPTLIITTDPGQHKFQAGPQIPLYTLNRVHICEISFEQNVRQILNIK